MAKAGMPSPDVGFSGITARTDGSSAQRAERAYIDARHYFDFCRWIILTAVFLALARFFLAHPVWAIDYVMCITASVSVMLLAFFFTLRSLHWQLDYLLESFAGKFGIYGAAIWIAKDSWRRFALILLLDILVIFAMLHALEAFAVGVLNRINPN